MLLFLAAVAGLALAAFSFQFTCYMNYKNSSRPSSLKCGHSEVLHQA